MMRLNEQMPGARVGRFLEEELIGMVNSNVRDINRCTKFFSKFVWRNLFQLIG